MPLAGWRRDRPPSSYQLCLICHRVYYVTQLFSGVCARCCIAFRDNRKDEDDAET